MNVTTAPNFYTGTSGLLLPVKNKFFYPEEYKNTSRLCYYSSLMNSIEINSSFYKIPMASTVERWASEVSADFKFTFKLFREITHQKKLAFDPSIITHFMEVIGNVGGKKGSLLVQLPPSVTIDNIQQIRYLATCLRENDPYSEWNTSFEFRHNSLYDHEIYHVLEGLDIGIVIHDKSLANTPIEEKDQSFVYVRFHGPDGNYRGTYPDYILSEYGEYIKEWLSTGKVVYAYFNNTMGDAINNLITLNSLVANLDE